nr:MAG TPA: hypothetical protein [Caudoviricetes sp.]
MLQIRLYRCGRLNSHLILAILALLISIRLSHSLLHLMVNL